MQKAQDKLNNVNETYQKGMVGFILWMLEKEDLTDTERNDLNAALKILQDAEAESFLDYENGDQNTLPDWREDKVVVEGDEKDAISLKNLILALNIMDQINELRTTDENFNAFTTYQEAYTNFYQMAAAEAAANRGAGLMRHSVMLASCENLAWGGDPIRGWYYDEKEDFDKIKEQLGIETITSLQDVRAIQIEASKQGLVIGHYTNLFYAVDEVMGVGRNDYSRYRVTFSYNASQNNKYNQYGAYTVDEFRNLVNEYMAELDTEKLAAALAAAEQTLSDAKATQAEKEAAVKTAQEAVTTAEQKIAEAKAAQQAAADQRDENTAELEEKEQALAAAEAYLTQVQGTLEEAEKALTESKETLSDAEAATENAQKGVDEAQEAAEQAKEKQQEAEQAVSEAGEALESIAKREEELKKAVEDSKVTLSEAEKSRQDANDQKGIVEEKAKALEEAVAASEKALEEAKGNAEEKEEALAAAETELNNAKQELEEVLAAHEELATAREVYQEKEEALQTAKEEVETAQDKVTKAEETYKEKEAALEEAEAALEVAENAENATNEELAEEGLTDLVELRENVEKAAAEVAEAKAALEEAQEAADAAQKRYDEAEAKYAAALAELARAQEAYDAFAEEETPQTKVYEINSGDVVEYTLGTKKDVVIVCDGALEALTGITIAGKAPAEGDYTVVSGSTILTLKSDYLETLAVGEYAVEFTYKDGKAEAKLIVKQAAEQTDESSAQGETGSESKAESSETSNTENQTSSDEPKTGDPGILGLVSGLGLSGTALAGIYMVKRKKREEE